MNTLVRTSLKAEKDVYAGGTEDRGKTCEFAMQRWSVIADDLFSFLDTSRNDRVIVLWFGLECRLLCVADDIGEWIDLQRAFEETRTCEGLPNISIPRLQRE